MKNIKIIILCIVFSLLSTNTSIAQNSNIGWQERLIFYYLQDASKASLLLDKLLSTESDNYTWSGLRSWGLVIAALGREKGMSIPKAKADFVFFNIVDSLRSLKCDFKSLPNKEKKDLMKKYSFLLESLHILCIGYEEYRNELNRTNSDLIDYFNVYIYGYRKIFNTSLAGDIDALASIYRNEVIRSIFQGDFDYAFHNLYPDILELHDSSDIYSDFCINSIMHSLYLYFAASGDSLFDMNYAEERVNFLLNYNDLELYLGENSRFESYYNESWKDIQSSLGSKECAVLLYPATVQGIDVVSYIIITPDCQTPIVSGKKMFYTSYYSCMKFIEDKYSNYEKIYICPIGDLKNEDVAYCNDKIYMKYSLYDLKYKKKSDSLSGRYISFYGDIEYGKKLAPKYFERLKNGGEIIAFMNNLYGNKFHSLSGTNVNKNNFYNINQNVGIFHVSTHGLAKNADEEINTNLDFGNAILGRTALKGYGLALSKYNEDNSNFMSVPDILKTYLHKNLLVYLDACSTGSIASDLYNPYRVTVAKAFFAAGARNIISYIIDVKEFFATDFALAFYKELHESPNTTFHEAFYKVKNDMKNKYENNPFIGKDKYGRSNLGIIFWE